MSGLTLRAAQQPVLFIQRLLYSFGDRLDLLRGDSLGNEKLLGQFSPAEAQRIVVLYSAARVCVCHKRKRSSRIVFKVLDETGRQCCKSLTLTAEEPEIRIVLRAPSPVPRLPHSSGIRHPMETPSAKGKVSLIYRTSTLL